MATEGKVRSVVDFAERHHHHAVVFDTPESIIRAAQALRADGYTVVDAHTPFAVHGLPEAIGMAPTKLPWATFAGGAVGGLVGMGFPIWGHAIDWPLNIGGKSAIAWQAIVPVAFEVVVLLAAFATVGGLFWRSRLLPTTSSAPVPEQPHPKVADHRFVLVVAEKDGGFSIEHFNARCDELGAIEVNLGWRIT